MTTATAVLCSPTLTNDYKRFCETRSRQLVEQITRAKESLLQQFGRTYGASSKLVRLALNEAEAIAWQTAYPHLVFPELAAEKARAAIEWEQRQEALNQGHTHLALAA